MMRSAYQTIVLFLLCMVSSPAVASTPFPGSAGGDELLSVTEGVPPNIVFVLDLSEDMEDPCESGGSGSCLTTILNVIDAMSGHYDWANYGLVGTAEDSSTSQFTRLIPLGTPHTAFSAALDSVSVHSGVTTVNLAETLATLMADYFTNALAGDKTDDDGDGFAEDWNEAPIEYSCQKNHVIVFTKNRPSDDETVPLFYRPDLAQMFNYTDIYCDSSSLTSSSNLYSNNTGTSTDEQCFYDQAVYQMYNWDARSDLSGDQVVTVHTIGIGTDSDSVADSLYENASDLIGGAGAYTVSDGDYDTMLATVLDVMSSVRSGTYSRSAPVVSADGAYLIYSYYEIDSDDPLAQGHVRAYNLDDDPTSSTYGQVLYNGSSSFGGAAWDGGTLLVSRIVQTQERNEGDQDGINERDIYTFFDYASDNSLFNGDSSSERRQPFDYDFYDKVGSNSTALNLILNTSSTNGTLDEPVYDLDEDDDVDQDDLQALIDFARGLPTAEFPALNQERGSWKLGDSPNSVPVVVQSNDDIYTMDPTYRHFLSELEDNSYYIPDIVLLPANDGMLHAFRLEEDNSTNDSEIGEELWAWIPGYLLYREHDAEWAGRLIDQMIYGRTFLFDGTPVVEDVWIDIDGDGAKSCTSVYPDVDCEWRRVVVVQQGFGGPVTLALDITQTREPRFLWEHVDESDASAMGYTVGRPVVANIYDKSDSSNPLDRYVAFWGSGRAVGYTSDNDYFKSTEANLYMWAMGDDFEDMDDAGYQDDGDNSPTGDNYHPEISVYGSSLDLDSDNDYEYAYISAALAVVDYDSDGDADTLYFPMTTAYKPLSEGGSISTITDPGSSWMYKACLDDENPGEFEFAEFYDPIDDGGLIYRPEVYYSATTAWHSDGQLGVYWGSGTPFDRDTNRRGYFFAVKDSTPSSCSSFSMTPITDCGATGLYQLRPSEGLTGDPLVYAGVVYFPTWTPASDLCDGGTGRLYGLRFDDCSSGLDTDGDGDADSSDDVSVSVSDSYISSVTVTDAGSIIYGTSSVTTDGSSEAVNVITSATNPFLGTSTIAWMEIF